MKDWYLMQPPNFYRGYELDEFHDYAREGFDEVLDHSPLSSTVVLHSDTELLDGLEIQAVIQNTTSDSKINFDIRQILCRIGTLRSGQYVEYKNRYWMVASLPDDNGIYEKALLLLCNHYLRWMNGDGKLVGRFCKVSDETKYTMGQNYKEHTVVLGETRMNIVMPRDGESLRLKRGKRFLISNTEHNPLAYSLTKYDDASEYFVSKYSMDTRDSQGLVRMICVEAQYNPLVDNPELMVADYYKSPVLYTLQILNAKDSLTLTVGDSFSLEVYATKNGATMSIEDIVFASSDTDVAMINDQGIIFGVSDGNCEIAVSAGNKTQSIAVCVGSLSVPDTPHIQIHDPLGSYRISFGDTRMVETMLYVNGDAQPGTVLSCELLNADGVAAIGSVKGNQVVLKTSPALGNVGKSFSLRVWNAEYGVEAVQEFMIVGLIG